MKAPPPGLTMSTKGERGGWSGVVHPTEVSQQEMTRKGQS